MTSLMFILLVLYSPGYLGISQRNTQQNSVLDKSNRENKSIVKPVNIIFLTCIENVVNFDNQFCSQFAVTDNNLTHMVFL